MHTRQRRSFLKRDEIKSILEAVIYAELSEYMLNTEITIHLQKAGLVKSPQDHITHFLDRACCWIRSRYPSFKRHYVWVLEATGGLNVHILIHVPVAINTRRVFAPSTRRWLQQVGGKVLPGVVNTKPINSLENLTAYLLKGAEPSLCKKMEVEQKYQGTILGKRWGCSQPLKKRDREMHPILIHADSPGKQRTLRRIQSHAGGEFLWRLLQDDPSANQGQEPAAGQPSP